MEKIRKTRVKNGRFLTKPGDVITVKICSYSLSSSISIELANRQTGERLFDTIPNWLAAWEWLKSVNEIGGRDVVVQTNDQEPIPFEESAPYLYRFGGDFGTGRPAGPKVESLIGGSSNAGL